MQKLEGDGLLFAGGVIIEKKLNSTETLRIDTGCLVAMTRTIDYDVQFVGGIKTAFFGGEGLFLQLLNLEPYGFNHFHSADYG